MTRLLAKRDLRWRLFVAGVRQRDIAALAGCSESVVSKILSSSYGRSTPKGRQRRALVLGYLDHALGTTLTAAEPEPARPCGDPSHRTVRSCLACKRMYSRAHRPRHHELAPDARRRANARTHANVAQRRGQLTPQPCERCGSTVRVEKHHEDYARPLQVRWICRPCHVAHHAGTIRQEFHAEHSESA